MDTTSDQLDYEENIFDKIKRLDLGQKSIGDVVKEIDTLRADNAALREELERERMRLVACGVAAMQNTDDSRKERITRDNEYCSQSYLDVCKAVDREIALREQLMALLAALEVKEIDELMTKSSEYFLALGEIIKDNIIERSAKIIALRERLARLVQTAEHAFLALKHGSNIDGIIAVETLPLAIAAAKEAK